MTKRPCNTTDCPKCTNALRQYDRFWSCATCLHRFEQVGPIGDGDEIILRSVFGPKQLEVIW